MVLHPCFEAGLDGFTNVLNRLIARFALRDASGKRGAFRNIPTVLFFD